MALGLLFEFVRLVRGFPVCAERLPEGSRIAEHKGRYVRQTSGITVFRRLFGWYAKAKISVDADRAGNYVNYVFSRGHAR